MAKNCECHTFVAVEKRYVVASPCFFSDFDGFRGIFNSPYPRFPSVLPSLSTGVCGKFFPCQSWSFPLFHPNRRNFSTYFSTKCGKLFENSRRFCRPMDFPQAPLRHFCDKPMTFYVFGFVIPSNLWSFPAFSAADFVFLSKK